MVQKQTMKTLKSPTCVVQSCQCQHNDFTICRPTCRPPPRPSMGLLHPRRQEAINPGRISKRVVKLKQCYQDLTDARPLLSNLHQHCSPDIFYQFSRIVSYRIKEQIKVTSVTLNTTGRETPYFFTDFRFRAWTVAPRGGK